MSKKLYQQLFDQNKVTVDELKDVTDQMEALQHTGRFAGWAESGAAHLGNRQDIG